jgi:hypothetical protein
MHPSWMQKQEYIVNPPVVFFTTEQAARLLQCSASLLNQKRGRADALEPFGGGPPFTKLRTGRVVYPAAQLLAWAVEDGEAYARLLMSEALNTLRILGKEHTLIALAKNVSGAGESEDAPYEEQHTETPVSSNRRRVRRG